MYLCKPLRSTLYLASIIYLISWFLCGSVQANSPVVTAKIDQSGDRLVVEFEEDVTVDNAEGFRLIGGVARINRLLSGNRSNRLVFQLTDYVLPDDQFKLLHWSELSSARVANQKLASFENVVVANALSDYRGNGKLYYVSSSQGNDGNLGLSKSDPLRTIARAQAIAEAGDFILLKRGDRWDTRVIITHSGQTNRYITYAAYDRGAKPIVHSMLLGKDKIRGKEVEMATIAIRGADYIQIDNIHVKTDGKGTARTKDDGIQIGDGAKYAIVSNCTVEGIKSQGYWGIRVTVDGLPNTTRPEVLNCEVFNYYANIGTQIWPHDGKHGIEEGGLIENCISRDPITPNKEVDFSWENIMINRGDFHGFVIRKNKVYNYVASGIETFGSKNVIVEYNEIYDPLNTNIGGKGIKAGGYNSAAQTAPGVGELYSENIIVRYNKVYNITRGNTKNVNAIDVNNSRSGEVYGNLIYNVKGIGIKITGELNSTGWEVYNNTVLDCGEDAIQVYTFGPYASNVRIKNNILEGKLNDIKCMLNGGGGNATGQNNLLLTGKASGSYVGKNDSRPGQNRLFVDESKHNYQLEAGSYAINKGVPIEGFTKGIDGNPIIKSPDMGAYQFGEGELPPSPAPSPSPSPAPAPSPSPSPAPAPRPSPSPAPAPQLEPIANESGLRYRYYHGSWQQVPDFSGMEAAKSGTVTDFSLEPRTQQDHYGFLFEGYIHIKQAGKYTFYTSSDDGSKLWIGEQLLVDNDGLHALQERLGVVYLAEGYHPIRVAFFDRKYADGLQVSYEATGIAKQIIPGEVLFTEVPQPEPIANESGLRYRYYHGSWQQVPDFSGMEAVKSGTVADFSLEPRTQQDHYGFLFEGYIHIKQAGKYTFYTSSDDGSKLWIGEQLLVDNDGLHALQERLGVVYLAEGYHPIRVAFFDRKYADGLQVSYEATGIAKQIIPGEVLFTDIPNQPAELIASIEVVRADAGGDRKLASDTKNVVLHGQGQGPHPFRRYSWEKVSGPDIRIAGQNTANAHLHNPAVGSYVFRFTAVDSEGNQGSDEMRLEVSNQTARITHQDGKPINDMSGFSTDVRHKIYVYPNPTQDVINLATTSGETRLPFNLYNQQGQLVHAGEVRPQAERASIELLEKYFKSGIYVLKVYSQQLGTQTFRLLKE